MSLASVTARGRAAAEARMTSVCNVLRKTGESTQDEDTGLVAATWTTTHADLPVRVAGAYRGAASSRSVAIAGVEQEAASRVAHLPHDTTNLADGDLIEITAGDSAGLVLRLIEADWADQQTARRVAVTAVDRPTEWD